MALALIVATLDVTVGWFPDSGPDLSLNELRSTGSRRDEVLAGVKSNHGHSMEQGH
jgi:hypothetical protein